MLFQPRSGIRMQLRAQACEVYAFAERLGGANSPPWQRRGGRAIKKYPRSFERRGRGSCEKIGIKRYSPPCITARRGGRAIQKISRSIRLSRGRGGFPMNPKGKPPRLRLLRWLRQIFFDDAATPPCGGAAKEGWPRHQVNGPIPLKARPGWFVQLPIIGGLNQPFFLVSPYRAHIRSAHARLRPLRGLRGIFLMGAATPPCARRGLRLSPSCLQCPHVQQKMWDIARRWCKEGITP